LVGVQIGPGIGQEFIERGHHLGEQVADLVQEIGLVGDVSGLRCRHSLDARTQEWQNPEMDDERLGEYIRVAIMAALLAVDLLIIYEQVKDRPDVMAARARLAAAISGRLKRARELRRAERHVVWEAIGVVEEGQVNDEP